MYKKKRKHKQRHLTGTKQRDLMVYQNCLKKNPTLSEIRFRYALCKYFGIDFEFDWEKGKKLPFKEQRQFHFPKQDKGYIVDFYIPKHKIVFEVDGGSHIGNEKYDKKRDKLLATRKIKTFRITNKQTIDHDFTFEFIKNAIESRCFTYKKSDKKKRKKRLYINLSRAEELAMQEAWLKEKTV